MKARKGSLDRRTLLRGAAQGVSVAVGLPVLEAMLNGDGTAPAQGGALPRATGPGWEPTEALWPLAPVKEHVTVISGTEMKGRGQTRLPSIELGVWSKKCAYQMSFKRGNEISRFEREAPYAAEPLPGILV